MVRPVELWIERILPFMRGRSTCAQRMAVADVLARSPKAGQWKCLDTKKQMHTESVLSGCS